MFKKLGVTAVAGGMLIAAAPAAADTATCRLDGPMTMKYTPGHGILVEAGRVRIRSEGEISCAGTLGGMPVSTAPGRYRFGGWAAVKQGCAIVTDSNLRLDAVVPRLITIWASPLVEATADLRLLGPLNGASVSGIGAAADQGLDIAGSASHAPRAGRPQCSDGRLAMTLTLRDGPSRPHRTTAARRSTAASEQPAAATKPAAKKSKKAVKRCARKGRTAKAKRAARRCRRAAARRRK